MDRKFKLLAASSLVVALASGCTPYNARTGTYDNTQYGSGASQGASQNLQEPQQNTVCRTCNANNNTAEHNQQWYIDRWNRQQQAQQNRPRVTYTPPPRTTYRRPAGEHTQQWYIDRWNRQQQAQQNRPRYTPPKRTYTPPKRAYTPPKRTYTPPRKTYSGYGGAKPSTPTNYYDYSKAGGYSTPVDTGSYSASNKSIYTGASRSNSASNKSIYTGASRSNSTSNKSIYTGAAKSNSASNKSIYTGSYDTNTYKPYSPKTYTSGANNTDSYDTYSSGSSSNDTYVSPSSSNTSSSNTYSGGDVATGNYKAGDSTYTVRKGDTVFSVMRLTSVYWKDIIKKNNLVAPYTISPGQVLRLK